MTSLSSLPSASATATSLIKSVSALDTNGDGVVSAAELAAAQDTSTDTDSADAGTAATAAAKLTSLLTNLSLDGANSGARQPHGPGGPPPAGGPPPGGKPPADGLPGHGSGADSTRNGGSSTEGANARLASIVERYQAD